MLPFVVLSIRRSPLDVMASPVPAFSIRPLLAISRVARIIVAALLVERIVPLLNSDASLKPVGGEAIALLVPPSIRPRLLR